MTTPTNPIERLDVPVAQVVAAVARLRWLLAPSGALAEQQHQLDPSDMAFARLACDHPEACSCAADYPGWQPGRPS